MAKLDIKVFNVLVHYGEGSQSNLLDLLDEVLLEELYKQSVVQHKEYMYPFDVDKLKYKNKDFLTGFFYKSATLKWTTTPDQEKRHKRDPGEKRVLPGARFFLDLENHRLFWITERGVSSSPNAYHFKSYVKAACLPILREIYEGYAKDAWKKRKRSKFVGTWEKFRAQYLRERNLNYKTFKVELNPEVSAQHIVEILENKNYLLKKAIFYPRLNNATKDHYKQLFTGVGQLADQAKATGQITLDPDEKKLGLNKKPIFELLAQNEKDQLLSFEFKLKDKNSDAREFTVSNANIAGSENIQKVETIAEEIDSPSALVLKAMMQKFNDLADRTRTSERVQEIKSKIRKLLK